MDWCRSLCLTDDASNRKSLCTEHLLQYLLYQQSTKKEKVKLSTFDAIFHNIGAATDMWNCSTQDDFTRKPSQASTLAESTERAHFWYQHTPTVVSMSPSFNATHMNQSIVSGPWDLFNIVLSSIPLESLQQALEWTGSDGPLIGFSQFDVLGVHWLFDVQQP